VQCSCGPSDRRAKQAGEIQHCKRLAADAVECGRSIHIGDELDNLVEFVATANQLIFYKIVNLRKYSDQIAVTMLNSIFSRIYYDKIVILGD
jgi:hypothetical protein